MGRAEAPRWWFHQHEWELAELLDLLVTRFDDPDRWFTTRFLLASAVLSASGFCEQRIMTAIAALEHLTWTTLCTPRVDVDVGVQEGGWEGDVDEVPWAPS